ncbi:hypothetical protein FMUND_9221 [Fusarium mundagurra]|uniref:DUF7580 domain-containing protein n=1 Tax=Fusarium mundagurra TaxID=1567541 RepID=A0A8H6DB49_9HYPO|nr:hypothetical protein FMUND_9221 [Fusarium mundagurra]
MQLLLKDAAKPQAQLEMIENPRHVMWKDGRFLQRLEQKLGKAYALLISMLREIESIIISIASSLDMAVSGEGVKKGLEAILQEGTRISQIASSGKAVQLQQRAKFAWKRQKIKSAIKELIECNARLNRILTASNQLMETLHTVETSGKADVGFVGPLDDISRNAARVHAALLRSWCVLGGCTHQAGILLEERLSRNVRSHTPGPMRPFGKAEHFSVSLWRDAVAMWLNAEFRLDPDELCQPGRQSSNRRVRFQPSHVLINEPLAQEVTDICTSIRQTTRSELGFLIDSQNVLHRLDRLDNPHGHLLKTGISLHDLLPELRKQSFALSDFYRLTITLASSVLQLRDTYWLHRSWNNQNIMFFRPGPDGESSADVRYPYLTINYETGHKKTEHLNMLGLAIMLMEIKTGTPIECHRHPDDLGSDGTLNASSNFLTASRWLRHLMDRGRLSWRYGDAVRYCIKFYDDYHASLEDADTQKQFREEVIGGLEAEMQAIVHGV